jgi:hypothetical protein
MNDKLDELKREVRRIERHYRRSGGSSQMGLYEELKAKLPSSLMPGNVGGVDNVTWDYSFPITFDLGTSPTIGPTFRVSKFFQVQQEAAFILKNISWTANSQAAYLAPFSVELRDRQSSRFFQNTPIPVQSYGDRYLATQLDSPLFIAPNAFVDITLSTWIPTEVTLVGPISYTFSFRGVRIRVQDAADVLGNVFG